MKKFIEVTTSDKTYLLNVNTISYIYQGKGKTYIVLLPPGEKQSRHIEAEETYDEVKALILAAL